MRIFLGQASRYSSIRDTNGCKGNKSRSGRGFTEIAISIYISEDHCQGAAIATRAIARLSGHSAPRDRGKHALAVVREIFVRGAIIRNEEVHVTVRIDVSKQNRYCKRRGADR